MFNHMDKAALHLKSHHRIHFLTSKTTIFNVPVSVINKNKN